MSEERRRRSGGLLTEKDVLRKLKENTYGGTKQGRKRRAEMPVNPISQEDGIKGIKIRFGKASDRYPSEIELKMTDGRWVKYQIVTEQPAFTEAVKSLKEGNWATGYQPEGKGA